MKISSPGRKKYIPVFAIFILLAMTFNACSSTPEETPAEEEKPSEEKSGISAPAANEDLRSRAAAAIARAEEAQAADYAITLLQEAKDALSAGDEHQKSDSQKAAESYELAIQKANEAYEQSFEGMKTAYSQQFDQYKESLLGIKADKFNPEGYAEAVAKMEAALEAFQNAEDPVEGARKTREALYGLQELKQSLEEQLRWASILKRDTQIHLGRAEEEEAFIWAPEVMEESSRLLMEGLSAQRQYDLDTAVTKMERAKYLAMAAYRYAIQKKKAAQADQRMLTLMERLERASEMTTMDSDGNVVEPEPWDGDGEVPENLPQPELEIEEASEAAPDTGKEEGAPGAEEEKTTTGFIPFRQAATAVLGDEQEESPGDSANTVASDESPQSSRELLAKARELWRKGVQARADNNLEEALEYFDQAEVYLAAYEALAVTGVYTVQARTENHDCLWRIAEYDSIYGNPFLWPRIWRRNRQLIQNPDLIYPGWKLLIPPQE